MSLTFLPRISTLYNFPAKVICIVNTAVAIFIIKKDCVPKFKGIGSNWEICFSYFCLSFDIIHLALKDDPCDRQS